MFASEYASTIGLDAFTWLFGYKIGNMTLKLKWCIINGSGSETIQPMMRSDDDVRAELRELFEFAHINKWCTQLDERITAFVASVPDSDREPLRVLLERECVGADAHNEQVVLVILLGRELGARVIDTTERLFARLRGRLDLADQRFVSAHLFDGDLPLPSDVNHDIVARPYLSFRRAISRAMDIETVSSTFSASEVALYLTLIMCRADLNEQNRAMLSFLLSRIDAELPQNVLEGVFVYLRSLRTVIAEVEGQGDAALAKEFHYSDEPTIEDRSRQTDEPTPAAPVASEPRPPAPAPPTPGATAASARNETAPRSTGGDTAPHARTEPRPPRAPASTDRPVRPPDRAPDTPRSDEPVPAAPDRASAGEPGISRAPDPDRERGGAPPPTRDAGARPAEIGTVAATARSDRHGDFDPAQGSIPPEADAGPRSERPRPTEDAVAAEEHTIYFNRNTAELLRIIDGLDRDDRPADTPARETPPIAPTPPTDARQRPDRPVALSEGGGAIQTRRSGKRLRRAAIAIVAAALSVIAVLTLRPDRSPSESSVGTTGAASDGATVEPPETSGDAASDAAVADPAPSIDRTEVETPEAVSGAASESATVAPEPPDAAVAYRIEFEGDRFMWTVQSGQTGWELFRAAGSAPIAGDGAVRYAVPPRVTWTQYILDVFAANPALAQFRIITPGQRIVLPNYR